MAKVAESYYKVDPWAVIEDGFDPDRQRVSESIFALANEFMGTRGYFDEGYSGDQLVGHYVNGLSEQMDIQHPQVFKGLQTVRGFAVNTVDWLYVRIALGRETLDLANSKLTDFTRRLDLRTGVLTRSFVWHAGKRQLRVTFERLLSLKRRNHAGQRITFEPLNFSGELRVTAGLDFSPPHEIASGWSQIKTDAKKEGVNFWTVEKKARKGKRLGILAHTQRTGQWLYAAARVEGLTSPKAVRDDKLIALSGTVALQKGKCSVFDKLVSLHWDRKAKTAAAKVWAAGEKLADRADCLTYDKLHKEHTAAWGRAWEVLDIQVDGDPTIQQGTRFSQFQMYATYQGRDASVNMPCKGMTGEVYYGWMFWDSETYVLPAYLFIDPKAARSLLEYRHIHLPQALERAKQLGCEGARFPFATIDGTECCGTWQHCDLEIHVNLAVSYALWLYVRHTGDKAWLHAKGAEVLALICRYLASRGEWGQQTGKFGFFGVMGPDEFHTMVNNNCYTNWMAKRTFQYALEVLDEMASEDAKSLARLRRKIGLTDDETAEWRRMADGMYIPYDVATGLYEQHDGYFNLPHVDVKNLPPSQIPIYANWVYEKIFRHDMIKQPDFLLLPMFYSRDFDLDTKRKNYEFYESRCIHESSLSPGVHSVLAAELGKMGDAYEFFRYMARLDLDNYNRNSEQGLHITAMSGVWLNIVYGFGGLRTDGEQLSFRPSIPGKWSGYRFRLVYRDSLIEIAVDERQATFKTLRGPEVPVEIYGRDAAIPASGPSGEGLVVPLEAAG